MKLEDIKKSIEEIKTEAGDDEMQHGLEDALYVAFIRFISESKSPYKDMAKEILKTEDLDFSRWCA